MGEFLAVTALRADDLDGVLDAVFRYARKYGVRAEAVDPEDADDKSTVYLWPPRNGWILLFWPRWFTGLQGVSQWLSSEFGTLVSVIDVYDGDLWNHLVWLDGVELDRFSSHPDYFTRDRGESKRLRREWAGRPQVIAESFGVAVEAVAPYLIAPYSSGLFGRWLGGRKPLPGDDTTLDDVWIFVDFWRWVGITYPDAPPAWAVGFRGGGHEALPSNGPSL